MIRIGLLLVVLLGLAQRGAANQNATITPGGSGSQLVETTCNIIQSACIFDDDKLLFRRMAYVESLDGHDPDTYRDGYHGGLWQVDEAFFDVTKSVEAEHELYPYFTEIHNELSIDWHIVTWQDCRRPLVSALAARLYIQYTSRDNHNGIPRDIESQADFWKSYYRTSGSTQDFINKCNNLETGCNSTSGADIVFVLDGSGSIGSAHFEEVKEFVKDVVNDFEIGPYKIGVIQFGSSVYPEFELKQYTTRDDIKSAVDSIHYRGGGTSTHLALERLIDESFKESNGARPHGIPKVGIIMTDGQSSSYSLTISEAERAHQAGIIMIAIGVGSSIDRTELEAIASDPKCLHHFFLSGFSEIDDLKYAIEKRACEAPFVVSPGHNGTDTGGKIPPGDNINCQIKIPSAGATISLRTNSGTHSTLFLAQDTYPSSVYYEEKLDSTPQNPGVVYIRNPHVTVLDNEWLIFCNLIGTNGTETNFTFGIRPGDTTHCNPSPCLNGQCVELVNSYRCDCFDGFSGSLCESVIAPSTTTPPPTSGYDCDANNPCTPENIHNGNFYFPHHDVAKFVQCDAHGGCFVMHCAPGTIWDPNLNTCNHAP